MSQVSDTLIAEIIMRLKDLAARQLYCELSIVSKPQVQQHSSSKCLILAAHSLRLLGSREPRPSNWVNTTKTDVH